LIFVVTLEPLKGVDGIRAIRAFLKLALRRFGLRCVDIQELPEPQRTSGISVNSRAKSGGYGDRDRQRRLPLI
jgi:hypothetical protein